MIHQLPMNIKVETFQNEQGVTEAEVNNGEEKEWDLNQNY